MPAFPLGCNSYVGPNPVECYRTIWIETGCVREGYASPDNMSRQNAFLDKSNLK